MGRDMKIEQADCILSEEGHKEREKMAKKRNWPPCKCNQTIKNMDEWKNKILTHLMGKH